MSNRVVWIVAFGVFVFWSSWIAPPAIMALIGAMFIIYISTQIESWGGIPAALWIAISIITAALFSRMDLPLDIVIIEVFWFFLLALGVSYVQERSRRYHELSYQQGVSDALRESKERLDFALMGSRHGLWDWNIPTSEVFRDERYLNLLGYTSEELEGTRDAWDNLIHPDDLGNLKDALGKHLEGRAPHFEFEHRIRTKSGQWRWMIDRGRVVSRTHDGRPLRVVGVSQDITERKEMEQQILTAQEWLKVTLRSIGDGVIATDTEGRIMIINQVAEWLTGWTEEASIGRPLAEVFHIISEKTGEPCENPVEKVLETGKIIGLANHTALVAKDGSVRSIADSAAPIRNNDGATIGVVLVFRDVTEEKRMEEALRASEETYRNLFHNAQVGLYRTRVEDGKVLEANDQMAQMFGYKSRAEMVAKGSMDKHYVDSGVRDQVVSQLAQLGHLENVEVKMVRLDGSVIWTKFSARRSQDGTFVEGVLVDTTLQKLTQESLKRSEERYRFLYDESPVGLVTCDRDGNIREINQTMIGILRMVVNTPEWSVNLTQIPEAKNSGVSQDFAAAVQDGEPIKRERRHRTVDGGEIWLRYKMNPVKDEAGYVSEVTIACEDITDIKEVENRIRYLSFHDKLTGLYNRAYFEEEQTRLDTERQLPLSVITGDLNGLKLVNDAFGHIEGDEFLKEAANILRESCRQEDIVARWGGDEFAVLLPQTDEKTAETICQRIKAACAASDRQCVKPSIALGVATKTNPCESFEDMIRQAEERMYRNKLIEKTSARSSIIGSLTSTLREKSCETEEHAARLRELAVKLGAELALPTNALDELELLAALHDIGKIAIPGELLNKPGKLSDSEWETIRKHPEIGYRIAQASPDLAPIADSILAHHERWDGKGYPRGLSGEEIPIVARIISLVDAYDVMTNSRPYKKPMEPEAALEEIRNCAGSQFDPQLAETFLKVMGAEKAYKEAAAAQEESQN